jgi:MYXO-CTERM domain-containing protein
MNKILAGTVSALALGLLAGTANAAFFSFASDNDSTTWTFSGAAASVQDAEDARDPQVLLIDDDNGILPTLAIPVEFDADFSIAHRGTTALAGGFVHNYDLSGSFAFLSGGNAFIVGSIINGSLAAQGGQNSWGSTATIQGNDQSGSVTYTFTPALFAFVAANFSVDLESYGISPGQSIGVDDAAFTLSVLNRGSGVDNRGVGLNPNTRLPASEWRSEGSFSGSSVIPSPGSLALLGLGGLVVGRRRR